ncbi:MAG TPA: DUF2934 domain-containing protein [Bryobacteraceae bacterium]|nr:DUF2934 domain-containing protein [Bryobacteraceae bacterium]
MSRKRNSNESTAVPSVEKPVPAKDKKSHSTRTRKNKGEIVSETSATADNVNAVAPQSFPYPNDQIARLAYSYWESRGFQHGYATEDWLRAERELLTSAK